MRKMSKKLSVIIAALVCVLMVAGIGVSASVNSGTATVSTSKKSTTVSVPDDRIYITSTEYKLVPGVTENVLTTNNASGNNQRIGFLMNVDSDTYKKGNVKIVACYKDYQYESLGLQTVTDQAKAYEKAHPGEKVIAGINADFYNMNTGAPSGAFVMNGTVYNGVNGRPYFAILKDGTAVIRNGSSNDLSDVQEAVAGNMMILTNGEVTVDAGDYQTLNYSRTAVGIKDDGSVVTYVTHGISVPTSCGETYTDVAKVLKAQGCTSALMLDGGGSATYASWREGTEGLKVQNNPSDGTPRTVSNTLLFASTVTSDGEFDHASITPNNVHYTPSTEKNETVVPFEAVGIDGSGSVCDLPKEGLTWELEEESKVCGSIDSATGVFTAKAGALGVVNVNLKYNEEVVGTTSIELAEPDELYFNTTALSLDFDESTDLGFRVKGGGVDLQFKEGDFDWTVKSTIDGVDDALLGSVENNVFTAGSKQDFALEGTVGVSYKKADGNELTAEVAVEIGKMPIVKMDFEDVDTNTRGKDVVGLWDWGASTSFFTDAVETQQYSFQNYEKLYYLQSTTYGADSLWINEVYETEQPWTENEDGTVTCTYKGKEYIGTKTEHYGVTSGEKWVEFTDENGAGYYWRVLVDKSNFSGNFNAARSASGILGADGYDMYVWHTSANPTSVNKLHGSGSQIVDASEGEVRFGNHSLKLTYDFTNFSPTGSSKNCNTYYRMTKPLVADGSPTGLGMWVYAPESMSNFWFWTQVTYWNGTKWADAYIHFRPSGASQTCQYTGVNWTGWTYVEADLSAVYAAGAVVDAEHPIQVRSGNPLILLTYIPGGTSDGFGHAIVCGSKQEGYFYIDNVRFVYGTNVDDMDNPEIISAKANDTLLSAKEKTTVTTNDITFAVDFTDPQGENYSGIDESATQLYLDGSLLETSKYAASADRAQTVPMTLANGEHTLKVSISDNFGNHTVKTYRIKVDNPDSTIPTVSIDRKEKAELGGTYSITVKANDISDIAKVSTSISYENVEKLETEQKYLENNKFYDDYGNVLTQGTDGQYYDPDGNMVAEPMRPNATGNYTFPSAVQKLGENFTGTIRNKMASSTVRQFTAEGTVKESLTDDTTLLTFNLPIPSTLTEDVKVPYTVVVTYETKDGSVYSVTSGDEEAEIYAYYSIDPDVQVSGGTSGKLTINTIDDGAVAADTVKVYSDAEEVTGTLDGNIFTTDYFVQKEADTELKNVYVADEANHHYSFRTTVHVSKVVGEKDNEHFGLSLNATTGDSKTTENITWLASTRAENAAKVQYMTKQAYEEAGSDVAAFETATTVDGTSKLTRFGADNVAAYINHVKLTGLSAGTTYVYRAGDGTNWSNPSEFNTMADGDTSFVVVGDTQLYGDITSESDQKAIEYLKNIGNATAAADFGLQTGDYVDGGINFSMWDEIMQVWGEVFPGKDFVHVMGNHENYGTDGSKISTGLFGLESSERNYYSVEYGDVYVAVINQTADLTEAAKWLVEDAAKTDCTWKVLTCHQPVYYSNPNGSSQGHNKILAPACDEAGIDFVFNGHDHSYVRTEQMRDGKAVSYEKDEDTNAYVDENGDVVSTKGEGTVYYICGDLGEKSRGDEYAIVDNPDFHFASKSQSYDALYLTVNATEKKMTVNAWNMTESGNSELIDTYTMYTGDGVCDSLGEHHISANEVKYNSETGKLICDRCGAEVDTDGYTGFAYEMNGKDEYGDDAYYFLAGKVRTGFFTIGEDIWYANDNGLIDHATENKNTNTCTVSGNRTAFSPRYNQRFVGGRVPFTGHDYEETEDGKLVCKTCNHEAIDVADWSFNLAFTTANYNGKAKYPAITIKNPATGETLEYATDGMGQLTDYARVWSDNTNVGTAKVVITINPKGDYTNSKGDVELTLQIQPDLPTNLQVTSVDDTSVGLSWTASKQADAYSIYQKKNGKWSKVGSTEDTSYTVNGLSSETSYEFAVRATKVVDGVTYTSLGYSDSVSATTTQGVSIKGATVKLTFTIATYNGNHKRPTPTVKDANGNTLVRNQDYTVEYTNNQNVGTAVVTIKGCGKYTGTVTTTFTIIPQKLTKATVEAKDAVFNGGKTTTNVIVKDENGIQLEQGKDYTLTFKGNNSVGTASVTVTGIGNYTGTISGTYQITPCDISEMEAKVAEDEECVYTGKVVTPAIELGNLKPEVDYKVSYEENVKVGTAKAILTGCGNYTGTKEFEFEIAARDIKDVSITDGSTYSYTGKEIEADLNVVDDLGNILVKDTDFAIKDYQNNIKKGIATVTIEGIGNYKGTADHAFEILSANVESFKIELEDDTYLYNGAERKPAVKVLNSQDEELVCDVDYTFEYLNNVNAGTATVEVTGIGNYTGVVSRNFTIEPIDISDEKDYKVTLEYTTVEFSGASNEPEVLVETEDGTKLVKDEDYQVTYENQENIGTAKAIVTGINNYKGTQEKTYEITVASIENCTASFKENEFYYSGGEITPEVIVKMSEDIILKNGVDYVVEYKNNVEVGKAELIISGIGNYEGTISLEFEIQSPLELRACKAALSYTSTGYTGKEKKPKVTVTAKDGATLVKNRDYVVTYSNNKKIGTATVKVDGIGKYAGTIKKTFKICPAKPKKPSVVSRGKTSIKVKFSRSSQASWYNIYVNGKYKGKATKANTYTIKNLKSKKSYKISIKAVKQVSGKKYYSIASSSITAKTK